MTAQGGTALSATPPEEDSSDPQHLLTEPYAGRHFEECCRGSVFSILVVSTIR